jgi:hypothetical protein
MNSRESALFQNGTPGRHLGRLPANIWVGEINGNGYANIAELRMINTNCGTQRKKVKAGSLLKITQMDEMYLLRHAGV